MTVSGFYYDGSQVLRGVPVSSRASRSFDHLLWNSLFYDYKGLVAAFYQSIYFSLSEVCNVYFPLNSLFSVTVVTAHLVAMDNYSPCMHVVLLSFKPTNPIQSVVGDCNIMR